jgi:hypothetical protein
LQLLLQMQPLMQPQVGHLLRLLLLLLLLQLRLLVKRPRKLLLLPPRLPHLMPILLWR